MISTPSRRLPRSLRALAQRNFRFYFFGQAISVLGSWIQQVAMAWLVYRLTGSAALLGVTAFCALVPQLLVGPLAGAWIDRQDKKKWLVAVQGALALQGFALAALTWSGRVGPGLLIAMALMLGLLNSFDTPLRQSLIGSFVGRRDDLPNALALNAMLFSIGRSIGPPIAGLLVGLTSEAACFAINGCSFLALMSGVLLIESEAPPRASGSMGEVLREGVRYAWHTWPVRMLIVIVSVVNLTVSSYAVLLPVFARDVFAGDAVTLGWLWGAAGCGALSSTLFLATRVSSRSILQTLIVGATTSAVALILFALSSSVPLAMLAMVGVGGGISASNNAVNMSLQSMAPERLRGRVVSFFTSARFGFDAVGGLLAGVLATVLGAGHSLLLEGALLLCFIAFVLTRRQRLLRAVADNQQY